MNGISISDLPGTYKIQWVMCPECGTKFSIGKKHIIKIYNSKGMIFCPAGHHIVNILKSCCIRGNKKTQSRGMDRGKTLKQNKIERLSERQKKILSLIELGRNTTTDVIACEMDITSSATQQAVSRLYHERLVTRKKASRGGRFCYNGVNKQKESNDKTGN